jgi:hypothetical protein
LLDAFISFLLSLLFYSLYLPQLCCDSSSSVPRTSLLATDLNASSIDISRKKSQLSLPRVTHAQIDPNTTEPGSYRAMGTFGFLLPALLATIPPYSAPPCARHQPPTRQPHRPNIKILFFTVFLDFFADPSSQSTRAQCSLSRFLAAPSPCGREKRI